MHGVELASRIRRLHPEVKVIFTSGYCGDDANIRFPGLFTWDAQFLQKPMAPEQLHDALQEMLTVSVKPESIQSAAGA